MERYRATHRRQDVIRSGTRNRSSSDVARGPDRPTAELARRCSHSSDDVQPRQRPRASWSRCNLALADRDARYAPRAPLDRSKGDKYQFRLQLCALEPVVRDLARAPAGRTHRYDDRHRPIPRTRELWLDRMLTQP